MTNEELLDDIKQFVAATVGQSEKRLEERLEKKVDDAKNELVEKIDELDLKLDTFMNATGEQLNDHELRLTSLEQQA